MSISALPQSTARLLGSSVTIACPLSLVKELIDNSVDAKATTIEVTVSADTISKIQVRDNGHGIYLDDFGSLGRRAHTSKLRTFEELRTKGGKTLGFRGEALASANNLATIKVTTRTTKDPVASQLHLISGVGGVEKKQPVSANVGTTVQALKLFETLPVRKQHALKESRKALPKIKKLLQAYALALPHIKLVFKVLEDPGQNWSYSPVSSTTREAMQQVFGASLATQGNQFKASATSNFQLNASGLADVELTAFLPRSGCESKILKDKGSFISVDARPISSLRGTGKKITVLFKKYWNQAANSAKSALSLSNPFMHLSITCSAGSYDPNVSPMKDELLFVDEQRLLDCFEALCKQAYESVEPPKPTGRTDDGLAAHVLESNEANASIRTPVLEWQRVSIDEKAQDGLVEEFQFDNGELAQILELAEPSEVERSGHAFETTKQLQQNQPDCTTGKKAKAKPDLTRNDAMQSHEKTPVEAMMRTAHKVDLGRNDSNASDEATITGSLPVQVIPRSPKSTPIHKARTNGGRGHRTPGRRFDDIGFYFQPRTEDLIEIATDQTATTGNTPEPEETISRTTGAIRNPLRELRDDDLNKMREETSSPEPDILQPRNLLRGDLDAPFHRRGLSVLSNHEAELTNRPFGSPSPPSTPYVPSVVGQRRGQGMYEQSIESRNHTPLQTPPNSNPNRSERRPNPPFRLPHSSNIWPPQSVPAQGGARQRALPAVYTMGNERERKPLPFGRSSPSAGLHIDRLRFDKETETPKQTNSSLRGDDRTDKNSKSGFLFPAPHEQEQG